MKVTRRAKVAAAGSLVAGAAVVALVSPASSAVAFFSGGLFLDVSVQTPAHLVAGGAAVSIPVQVTCNATDFASVSVTITEKVGKRLATGYAYSPVGCTGGHQTLLLTATAAPESGSAFAAGKAFASAMVDGCRTSVCGSENGSRTVTIRR